MRPERQKAAEQPVHLYLRLKVERRPRARPEPDANAENRVAARPAKAALVRHVIPDEQCLGTPGLFHGGKQRITLVRRVFRHEVQQKLPTDAPNRAEVRSGAANRSGD